MIHSCLICVVVFILSCCLISTWGLHLNFVVLYNDNKDHSFIHSFIYTFDRNIAALCAHFFVIFICYNTNNNNLQLYINVKGVT